MQWIYLSLAIVSEVVATSALKAADGFSRLWPSVLDVVGYVEAGSAYTGVAPERVVDTRAGTRTGPLAGDGPGGDGHRRAVAVLGREEPFAQEPLDAGADEGRVVVHGRAPWCLRCQPLTAPDMAKEPPMPRETMT